MNQLLETTARNYLREQLPLRPEAQQNLFKRMYGFKHGMSTEEVTAQNVLDVIDRMPVEKLDWALSQVQNTLKKEEPCQTA